MPTYVYELLDSNNQPTGEQVELFHPSSVKLTTHPETGSAIRKIFTPPFIAGPSNERKVKKMVSNENLAAKGFTRYEKDSSGMYHRTAGNQGPSSFKKPT